MTKDQQRESFQARCKELGVKLTPQRLIIYDLLMNTTEHPTADRIYAQVKSNFPTISLDTVHRTLVTFCDIGVARLVEGTGSPKRFEGNLTTHHHARCLRCGKILDIYHDSYDTIPVPQEVQQDFQVLRKIVHLEGICRTCREETRK